MHPLKKTRPDKDKLNKNIIFAVYQAANCMRKRTIALIAILTALLAACTETTGYNTTLVQADSLMASHPDSALRMLQGIPAESLKTKADRAYHALLLTQARDKNYIVQTDDSLIRIAVRYYDSMRDNRMQARVYYLWGSVCRDKNRQTEAIENTSERPI